MDHFDHVINLELLRSARQKLAFIPSGDPSMGGAPPGAPPGGDPAAGGGMPPGAPPGMPPGDPAAAGGPPPGGAMMPPPGGGGGGMDPMVMMQQIMQKMDQMGGGGAGGAGGALKPKVDVNMVMLQILKILARIADSLGVQIPASEMVPGQADMQQLAQATSSGGPMPGMDPSAGAGGAPPGQQGGVPPLDPTIGKQAFDRGSVMPDFVGTTNKAQAVARIRQASRQAS